MANTNLSDRPFFSTTQSLLVAIKGARNGYVQLAPSAQITRYGDLPNELLLAAKDWAARLETLGAKRVYWITLSEAVTHLHIHLYPRWTDDEVKGVALFEDRCKPNQPEWTPSVEDAFSQWAHTHDVSLISGCDT